MSFFIITPLTPRYTLFPYTTLFRSRVAENLKAKFAQVRPDIVIPIGTAAVQFVVRRRRSEEHTSELQSPVHLVCRLLLEKKKAVTFIDVSFHYPASNAGIDQISLTF